MQQSLKHKHKEEYNVTVTHDQNPISPREWDNIGIMVCWHSRYDLGDKQPTQDAREWEQDAYVSLPLYLYDHSGLSMNTTGFSCSWDSGQVGYIYTTKERLKKTGHDTMPNKDKVKEWLKAEVETYNKYLTGEVYAYIVEKITYCGLCDAPHKEVIDSCGGFYGLDNLKEYMGKHAKYWDGETIEY